MGRGRQRACFLIFSLSKGQGTVTEWGTPALLPSEQRQFVCCCLSSVTEGLWFVWEQMSPVLGKAAAGVRSGRLPSARRRCSHHGSSGFAPWVFRTAMKECCWSPLSQQTNTLKFILFFLSYNCLFYKQRHSVWKLQ